MAGIIGAKHRQVGRFELTIFSEKEKNPKSWPKWANLPFLMPKFAINLHFSFMRICFFFLTLEVFASLASWWLDFGRHRHPKERRTHPAVFFVFGRCFVSKSHGSQWNPSTFFLGERSYIFRNKKHKNHPTHPPKKNIGFSSCNLSFIFDVGPSQ